MYECKGCGKGYIGVYLETTHTICEHCGHDNNEEEEYLTKEEVKLLWEFFSNQYINYENIPLLTLVRKISAIANENQ